MHKGRIKFCVQVVKEKKKKNLILNQSHPVDIASDVRVLWRFFESHIDPPTFSPNFGVLWESAPLSLSFPPTSFMSNRGKKNDSRAKNVKKKGRGENIKASTHLVWRDISRTHCRRGGGEEENPEAVLAGAKGEEFLQLAGEGNGTILVNENEISIVMSWFVFLKKKHSFSFFLGKTLTITIYSLHHFQQEMCEGVKKKNPRDTCTHRHTLTRVGPTFFSLVTCTCRALNISAAFYKGGVRAQLF